MNFAYFRKSNYSLEKTIAKVKELSQKNWKILGEVNLPNDQGTMVLICKPEWLGKVVKANHQLLGFLPCSITIFKKGHNVLVGTGQPAVIKALAQSIDIVELATQAEVEIKDLIHQAAGVEELKPSGVKLYSTTSCPYCKMEKVWLDEKKVSHEVVYVDLNTDEAQKMVEKTGQMGVPVTEIEFEEGEPQYIIGFDKPTLSQLLGVN